MRPLPARQPDRTEVPAARAGPREDVRRLDVQKLPDHRDKLFRAAYALCRSYEDAEDLVQATFERVLIRPRFLRRGDDLSYLLRVLRNTWINSYHQRSRRPQTVEFDESIDFVVDHGADPGTSVMELKTIYATIGELPPRLRDTLVAVDVVGLSYREAAAALGIRQGTVMSRLFRARNQVADLLQEAGIGPRQPTSDR